MSNKGKKKTIKNNKKTSKIKKSITLKLDNGAEMPAKTTYKRDDDFFEINDIDIDKIRVSDKKLYTKMHNSYKYYVFYEYNYEYISLRIVLKDVEGFCNEFKDSKLKTMNVKLGDESALKISSILEHIEKI